MPPFLRRLAGAALLRPAVYRDVAADRGATGEAVAVVLLVALCYGVGTDPGADPGPMDALALLLAPLGVAGALLAWLLGWAATTAAVHLAGRVLGGTARFAETARALGFAQVPGVLALLDAWPSFAGVAALALVLLVWTLAAGVVGARAAMRLSTGKAVAAVLAGWVAWGVLRFAVGVALSVVSIFAG